MQEFVEVSENHKINPTVLEAFKAEFGSWDFKYAWQFRMRFFLWCFDVAYKCFKKLIIKYCPKLIQRECLDPKHIIDILSFFFNFLVIVFRYEVSKSVMVGSFWIELLHYLKWSTWYWFEQENNIMKIISFLLIIIA